MKGADGRVNIQNKKPSCRTQSFSQLSSERKNTPKRTVFSWNVALNRTPCDKITPDYTNMPVGI